MTLFGSFFVPVNSFALILDRTYVPDPYYEDREGFELVLDMLEDSCQNLLDEILTGQQNAQ